MKTKTTKKKKLTKRQMAVAIAKDALAQIKARRYMARNMTYVSGIHIPDGTTGQLQPHILKKSLKCRVCALGATFLSSVRLFNDFDVNDGYTNDWKMRDKLAAFFPEEQIKAIEVEFETWEDSILASTPFARLRAKQRMIFLMKEIIRQKGSFDPRKSIKEANKL